MPPYKPKNIDCKKIKPHATELVLRCGSHRAAGEYSGVDPNTFSNINRGIHCTVRMETARKILDALERKRAEDRKAGGVNNRLIKEVREKVKREEKMKF